MVGYVSFYVIVVLLFLLVLGVLLRTALRAPESNTHIVRYVTCILLFFLIFSIGIYHHIGTPDALKLTDSSDLQTSESVSATQYHQLKTYLQNNQDDEHNWLIFYRLAISLGNYTDALTAAKHITALTGSTAEALLLQANALLMLSAGKFNQEIRALIERAHEIESENHHALWLLGLDAQQQNNHSLALEYWQALLESPSLDPETHAKLLGLIDQLKQ